MAITVKSAAAVLAARGIRCRRDWGSAGRWLAEHGATQYCVGGLDLVAAAVAADPIASLDAACSD
jgi:hypothetical protein